MKRTLIALAIVLPALAPRPASAQVSIWLQRGVSGYAGALTFGASSTATTFGVAGGYSYEGYLELDLNLNYINYDKDSFAGASVHAFAVAPAVQYHPLKQSAEMPVSLGLTAQVAKLFFSSSDLDSIDTSLSETDLSVNASVYRFVKLTSNIGIIPAGGVGVTHSWASVSSPLGDVNNDDTSISLAFGAYLAYIDDAGRIWGLVPSVTVNIPTCDRCDTVTVFGLELGLIISQQ